MLCVVFLRKPTGSRCTSHKVGTSAMRDAPSVIQASRKMRNESRVLVFTESTRCDQFLLFLLK